QVKPFQLCSTMVRKYQTLLSRSTAPALENRPAKRPELTTTARVIAPAQCWRRRRSMRRYFIGAAKCVAVGFVVMGVAIALPRTAGAFVAHQNDVAKAAAATNATIEVKRSLQRERRRAGITAARSAGTDTQGRPVNSEDELNSLRQL